MLINFTDVADGCYVCLLLQDFKEKENCYENVKSSFSEIASLAAKGAAGMP